MEKISISTEYVTLGQFLKLAHIIGSGGESKQFILNNKILVNGTEESRRGRKIKDGDLIELLGKKFVISCLNHLNEYK